jgi:hypothetical protein
MFIEKDGHLVLNVVGFRFIAQITHGKQDAGE